MNISTKKLKNGFELPVLGLGTFRMGGGMESDFSHDAQDIEAIKGAINLGIRHIDTAEIYGGGHAEELVGEAIGNFDQKKLILASKVTLNLIWCWILAKRA